MNTSRAIQEKREQQFAAATSEREVTSLMKAWDAEDEAARHGETSQAKELADLRARVRKLESWLGPNGSYLADALGKILARQRMEIAAQQMRFLGVHEPGRQYSRGSMVVRSGGLWHCDQPTTEAPGKSDHWQLAVKSGEANERLNVA